MTQHYGVESPVNIQLPVFGISAFVSRHAGHFTMKTTRHDHHEVALVVRGSGALQAGESTVKLSTGSIVRIAPRVDHRFVDDPQTPLTLAFLCMADSAGALLPLDAWSALERTLPVGVARWLPGHALLEVRHLLQQITLKCSTLQAHSSISISGLAAQVVAIVLDEAQGTRPARASETFAATILWIDRHFTEAIRVEDLAEEAGISYRAYTQQFRKATGVTVVDYVTRLRIQFAAQCLLATGDILDSALEAGFGDLTHFYRVFRKHTGATPGEFLKCGGQVWREV